MKTNFFEYGSTWLRADFHLHTKADKEFEYTAEENAFTSEYVAQLKKENIRIGLISNHNKFAVLETHATQVGVFN